MWACAPFSCTRRQGVVVNASHCPVFPLFTSIVESSSALRHVAPSVELKNDNEVYRTPRRGAVGASKCEDMQFSRHLEVFIGVLYIHKRMRSAPVHSLRNTQRRKTHLKHEQSTTTNSKTQPTSLKAAQSRGQFLRRHIRMTLRSMPGRVREPSAQERLVAHAYAFTGRRRVLRYHGHERPERHEYFVHGHRVRRLRRRFDLDAKIPLRSVRKEVAWGCPATGAYIWEESEGADICEGVGQGEGVAADRYWRGIFLLSIMLMILELVDVKDDLVWSLRRNRWDDEMAIIEEGENHFVMAAYSDRLCDPDQSSFVKCVCQKKIPFSHEQRRSSSSR